jgi:colanic acid/amylovoran biosynthesis protein
MIAVVRIFIDPGGYILWNIGDAAMLEMAFERLRAMWPGEPVTIHTFDPDTIRRFDPTATTLDPSGARAWSVSPSILRRRAPALARMMGSAALRVKRRDPSLVARYLDAVSNADLVLITGAGSMNDEFSLHTFKQLETLELAIRSGAATALVGQGIGPLTNPALRDRAADVLRRVDSIGLRERIVSLPLLQSFGVAAEKITVTGDDAIALAYRARPERLGTALGVNLRVAGYSRVGDALLQTVGAIVRDAEERHAPSALVPVPISRLPHEDDLGAIRQLLGDPNAGDDAVRTPAALLAHLQTCRVVVAGSYHAAVLSLSMGIPVVTVAKSQYYIDKFRGLAGQFGSACRVTVASDSDFEGRLRSAIDDAWISADEERPRLLESAREQIALTEAAYRRLPALVESRAAARAASRRP